MVWPFLGTKAFVLVLTTSGRATASISNVSECTWGVEAASLSTTIIFLHYKICVFNYIVLTLKFKLIDTVRTQDALDLRGPCPSNWACTEGFSIDHATGSSLSACSAFQTWILTSSSKTRTEIVFAVWILRAESVRTLSVYFRWSIQAKTKRTMLWDL